MFCRYKNLENFQNIWGAVLLFIIKKRYHFQMNWYQLGTWSDITLECDITVESRLPNDELEYALDSFIQLQLAINGIKLAITINGDQIGDNNQGGDSLKIT